MLDPNALSQLSQLKTEIVASKDYAEGTVAATSGRYGFVRTDDGRDAFLSPDKMDRLLPGDRVKIVIVKNKKDKNEAEVEKLLSSELTKFVGQYRIKGAGHFVVPSGAKFTRWIFVPPAQRKGSKEGDYVVAKVARHPFKDGKAQANVVFRIGQPNDDFIEHKYTKAKYDLNYRSDGAIQEQMDAIQARIESTELGDRADHSDTAFFTIDSASTLDMDDALSVTQHDDGNYTLAVAIADPSSFISNSSPLGKRSQKSSQSCYLLGGTVPMLPSVLSHNTFSLEQEKLRPALLCELDIAATGEVTSSRFQLTKIRSHSKLSYLQVSEFLDTTEGTVPEELKAQLTILKELAGIRRAYREEHYLVAADQDDFDFQLDKQGKIESIARRQRNSAQKLVEESMIAANIAAGELLAKHNTGLHLIHNGFRPERIGEAHAVLKEDAIEHNDLTDLSGFVHLHKSLSKSKETAALIPPLRRMMQTGELSTNPSPHMSMGVAHYANITSPIRRFADLYNHWCLQSILSESKAPTLSDTEVADLNESVRNGRQADRELQQWLVCQYVKSLLGSSSSGRIRIITQQGFGVKLNDNGIEGFVLFSKGVDKSYDAKRMTLTVGDHCYRIDDDVDIVIKDVDFDKRRIAFTLPE